QGPIGEVRHGYPEQRMQPGGLELNAQDVDRSIDAQVMLPTRSRADQHRARWRADVTREAALQCGCAREVEVEPGLGRGHERQQSTTRRRLARSRLVVAHDPGQKWIGGD